MVEAPEAGAEAAPRRPAVGLEAVGVSGGLPESRRLTASAQGVPSSTVAVRRPRGLPAAAATCSEAVAEGDGSSAREAVRGSDRCASGSGVPSSTAGSSAQEAAGLSYRGHEPAAGPVSAGLRSH